MEQKYFFYGRYLKRPLDALMSAAGIAVLSPLMLTAALLVRGSLGSPVIFRQERPGLKGKIFSLRKFRTMTREKGAGGALLPDSERLPAFGRFLRSLSLDELPELFNILAGDMSFIGPRPLLVEYLPLYSREQRKRHDVRPGLTGLAQVSGRNLLSWGRKFELDAYYAGNVSFFLDCRILIMTPGTVFRRRGAHKNDGTTMEKFKGET